MKRRTTREDVARKAGVSKTTVTYVLGDRRDIAIPEATRERVRLIARQLGYQPHAAAQALASGRTNTITVALPIRIGSHSAHVLQALERQTNAHGYQMVASTVGHIDFDNARPDLDMIFNSLSDGVILVDMPAAFRPMIREAMPPGMPVVSIGVFTVPETDSVEVTLRRGIKDALAHLLASDPKRLAFFGPGGDDVEGKLPATFAPDGDLDPRPFAYCEAMRGVGRPIEIILGNPNHRERSMEALRGYVTESGCPDALLCFNDDMAIAAHRALREIGLRVPEDVRLVGCDGSEEGEYMNPPLSTIVQPIDRISAEAWDVMLRRLADPELPRQEVVVEAEFVQRGSSLAV